jgi:hypothetical protein
MRSVVTVESAVVQSTLKISFEDTTLVDQGVGV